MELVKTLTRRVHMVDGDLRVAIGVFSSDAANGHVTMSPADATSESYYGSFDVTMPKAFARALGEALIAVAEET